jgi:hypothetical protein
MEKKVAPGLSDLHGDQDLFGHEENHSLQSLKDRLQQVKKFLFLEWRAGLLDTILKGTHPGTNPARFGLIWFRSFRGDLNVIFYQNMPNLHNRYKSAERKISQNNSEYMLNYSLPCSCS